MRGSWRAALWTALRLALGVGLLAWLTGTIEWAALWRSLRAVQPGWLAAAALSFWVSTALKILRWQWLLDGLTPRPGWLRLTRAFLIGAVVNIVGIGRLGEVARVALLRQESGLPGAGLAASVVVEKLIDLACLGAAAAVWLALLLDTAQRVPAATSGLALAFGALLALALAAWRGPALLARLPAWIARAPGWLQPRLNGLTAGLAGLTRQPVLGRVLALTLLIWLNMLLTNLLLLPAVGLPFSPRLALSVIVIGLLGLAANLTPANIGPYHWTVAFALTVFGAAAAPALAYAFLLHGVTVLLPLAAGLALNGWHLPRPAEGR